MRAGRLRRRVKIYSVTKPTSPGASESETEVDEVWAAIEPQQGRSLQSGGQEHSEVDALILMRYRSDVTKSMRIGEGTRRWEIDAVIPDARRRQMELAAKELV